MVAHAGLRSRLALAVVAALGAIASGSCDKLPLLAPQGTVITLFANNTVLPLNGSVDITAIAIEAGAGAPTTPTTPTPTTPPTPGTPTTPTTPAPTPGTPGTGTPVHNGTVITFTTTVGRIEPTEARTHNGQATVRLISSGQSGIARIVAFSGGARSTELMINVGTAAVERVLLRADSQSLPATGGSTRLIARVEDVGGGVLSGVPVTFTTTAGRLDPTSANTDANGEAVSTLTTSLEANVTATAGSKTSTPSPLTIRINPRAAITITPPTTPPTVGQPATFTIGVAAAALVTNVRVNWGDGTSISLGALSANATVQHTYRDSGTFTATATATTALGDQEAVSTEVTVLPAQPPGVTISASDSTPDCNQLVIFTATVTGAISTVTNFAWEFEDGSPGSVPNGGSQQDTRFTVTGTKVIRVTVTQSTGPIGQGATSVVVGGTCTN
jgi:Bacterial Ig-like domain (group 1)/PKD domain